jgi:hypothetical protein
METNGFLSHLQEPQRVPIVSQFDPAQDFLSDYPHLPHGVPLYYFMNVSLLNPVCNSPLRRKYQMPCPTLSSCYCHPDNVWCNVLCSLVISCLWCHSNIIWCEKDAIFVPDTDDTVTDIKSWYWILVHTDCMKCCGLHLQTRHVHLWYLLLTTCIWEYKNLYVSWLWIGVWKFYWFKN